MVVSCWSAKGGMGTTVVAAALAITLAEREGPGVLLVDLAGDLPAVLGMPEPESPGIVGWAAAGVEVPADALARIEVPVRPGLALLPRGDATTLAADRLELLRVLLGADDRTVVVDCGTVSAGAPTLNIAASAPTSILVIRACYLALRRAVSAPIRPSAVALVGEPGRALNRADIEAVLGVPVVAEIGIDPGIARAVDAGLLASRMPRGLQRALKDAA